MSRQLHLGAFIMGVGHHAAAWRLPGAAPANLTRPGYFKALAQTAERGKFDYLFFADRLALSDRYGNNLDASVRYLAGSRLDPVALLGLLAGATSRIGLAATASTTFNDPFSVARRFATLDHLSEGRIGWNIVTSTNDGEALNFGDQPILEHEARYRRAKEFVEVALGLWDSWEDDALLHNGHTGEFAEPSRVHYLNHQGEYFSVRGPLNVPRSPQGRPVLIQAGSSDTGQDFAAELADVIFTAQPDITKAQAFYQRVQQRVREHGRAEGALKIMPGVMPFVAASREQAQARFAELEANVHPLAGLALLADSMNHDLSVYPLDEPLPALAEIRGNQSRFKLVQELSQREGLTLRELGKRFGGSRSHRVLAGTAKDIADDLEQWFEGGACDGFNIMPPYLPEGLDTFVEQVVPELQRRGLFRRDYQGSTLREHLGLARPPSRFSQRA
ncbi:LLM class flavin-dependent oxidoreductase [Pseudomonas typographi]|uniref:LLM class flavin-dependent oxidoreductase n=1 Tax=Pseudomonas typographi TaxID=2715964 RepID=A0ABR7YX32_9PSED|nr:LLM class flavin-dependent oxidoreductase [Pseudomonas typographi]MBD1551235.1 LLM class flavin-dependent oxidoreductase [Pseudomonas typographi]MBD1586271.1 LLM class flavin-dependent oxidoreductase [Pseudomonas typographi]MBD1597743.1 LLM class flavin-dependent oxidoreductase [Pseudomonas typographi]